MLKTLTKLAFLSSLLHSVMCMGAVVQSNIQRHLTTADGLNTDKITNVHQGPNGYLWITSTHGLNRFDGNEILKFSDSDLPFQSSYIDKMTTFNQNLVLNNVNIGLYLLDLKTYTATLIDNHDKKDTALVELHTHDNKLVVVRQKTIELLTIPSTTKKLADTETFYLPRNTIKITSTVKINNYILCATHTGLHIFDLASLRWLPVSNSSNAKLNEKLNHLVAVTEKRVIAGSKHALFDIDISDLSHPVLLNKVALPNISINDMSYFQDIVFISTNKGISSLNLTTQISQRMLSLRKILPNSRQEILGHMIDKNGNIWFWGDNVGLFSHELFNPNFYNYYYNPRNKQSLPHPNVWGITPAKNSNVKFWITTTDGICLLDSTTKKIERYPIKNADNKFLGGVYGSNLMFNVVYESDTHLWIDAPPSMLYVNKETRKLESLPMANSEQFIKNQVSFYLSPTGQLWATKRNNLHYIDVDTFQYTDLTGQLSVPVDEPIFRILGFIFNDDRLVYSTPTSLASFNVKSKKNTLLFSLSGDISPTRYNFFESFVHDHKRNIIWLTHLSEGLVALNADTLLRLPQHSVKDSVNAAYGLMLDDTGYLWFSSHTGIVRYTPETQHVLKFSKQDGLGSTEFNGLAWAQTTSKNLLYGGTNGVTEFSPSPLLLDSLPNTVRAGISRVELGDGTRIQVDNQQDDHYINVDYMYNAANILLSSTQFHIGHNTHFKYKVIRNKKVSEKISDTNMIELTQLAYGKTSLEIQAISNINGDASKTKRIIFNVNPPFWKSPVAFTFYLLLVLSGAIFAWKMSKRNLIISYSQLAEKEQRFRLALSGSNSEVWEWRHDTNSVYGLRLAHLKSNSEDHRCLSHTDYMSKIHPEDIESYQLAWAKLIESNESNVIFKATYRIQHNDGTWVWYKDLGNFVPTDQDSAETRITGTYSDITEVQTNQTKLQRYGEVLQCSLDWVLLINHDLSTGQANQALCQAFNIDSDQQTVTISTIFTDPEKLSYYQNIMLNMGQDSHWKGEDNLHCADKHSYHLLINISCQGHGSQRGYIMIMSDITELKKAEQELRSLALEDQLTGLHNRRSFLQELSSSLITAKNNQQRLAVGFIDLNGFKKINDTFGHAIGDQLLQTVAQRLQQTLSSESMISRIGGDEFSLIIANQAMIDTLETVLSNIIVTIQQPMTLTKKTITIDCSIGVAIYPQHGSHEDELIHHADLAMYLAKTTKAESFLEYNRDMISPIQQRLMLEDKLTLAFKNEQFVGYYQPIVDTVTRQIRGIELLMRWTQDEKIESIGHYTQIAEEMGILSKITQQLLDEALVIFKQWLTMDPTLFLSINISAEHIKQADLSSVLINQIAQHQLPANSLCLEISEKATSEELLQSNNNLAQISKNGILIGIDDFGIQAASFSRLRELDVDFLKIDMSFIQGIHNTKVDQVIICKIVEISEKLSIRCIAEGVETEEQWHYLQSIGCQLCQGYLFSHALPEDEITNLLMGSHSQ